METKTYEVGNFDEMECVLSTLRAWLEEVVLSKGKATVRVSVPNLPQEKGGVPWTNSTDSRSS